MEADWEGKASWVARCLRVCVVGVCVKAMMNLNLPRKCGVMVLPNCTLFPQGGLPLYIFEERYRIMLERALEGDCLFAVGRSIGEDDVAPIGTIGLIRASKENDDGTSELFLHGIIRVKFQEWLDDEPYPCALIEPVLAEPLLPNVDEAARQTLQGVVDDTLSKLPKEIGEMISVLFDRCDDAGMMADLVADRLLNDPDMRQSLLEEIPIGKRVSLLCEMLGKNES